MLDFLFISFAFLLELISLLKLFHNLALSEWFNFWINQLDSFFFLLLSILLKERKIKKIFICIFFLKCITLNAVNEIDSGWPYFIFRYVHEFYIWYLLLKLSIFLLSRVNFLHNSIFKVGTCKNRSLCG